jgi:hypothetical protein
LVLKAGCLGRPLVGKSLGLYRECAGDVTFGGKTMLIAGAFPILTTGTTGGTTGEEQLVRNNW